MKTADVQISEKTHARAYKHTYACIHIWTHNVKLWGDRKKREMKIYVEIKLNTHVHTYIYITNI